MMVHQDCYFVDGIPQRPTTESGELGQEQLVWDLHTQERFSLLRFVANPALQRHRL